LEKILDFPSSRLEEYTNTVDLTKSVQVRVYVKMRFTLLLKSYERVSKSEANGDGPVATAVTTNMVFARRLVDSEMSIMKSIVSILGENV
jgi:hypothetical protein